MISRLPSQPAHAPSVQRWDMRHVFLKKVEERGGFIYCLEQSLNVVLVIVEAEGCPNGARNT